MVKKKRIRRTIVGARTAQVTGVVVKLMFHVLYRLVEFEKREGTPGLVIYRRGPPTWTPIGSAAKIGPIASRIRSKTAKTYVANY